MWDGGRAGVGGWYHDGQFSRFLGGTEDGTAGFYALVEHRVWSPGDDRGVDLFAQLGFANESVSDAAMHLAGGLNWAGPFASRSDDALGLYCSFVDLSEDAGYADDELVIELFYKLQVTPFMSIKPDLQYIINPSGDSTLDDAFVFGLRAETTF
jgi:porin